MSEGKPADKIGLWTCTALVVGNMIGSGVFLLPATLSVYGTISLFGWVGSSVGAIALAVLFSRLSKMVRNSIGGPYAYTREGMGEFAAFLVAWGYWFSIWCTNAAVADSTATARVMPKRLPRGIMPDASRYQPVCRRGVW